MNKLTKSIAAAIVGMIAVATSLQAAPALRKPQTILQPNGTTITIVQQGDEWCHWVTNLDGQMLMKDAEGNYHVATEAELAEWEAGEKAHGLQLREAVNKQRHDVLKAGRRAQTMNNAPAVDNDLDNHAAAFPSKGQIHGLIVLVEYTDVTFNGDSASVAQHYQDMIKKDGYNDYYHQGSAHDFFYQNSMGQFDPQFDIYGPLKLKHNRKHYGKNTWGSDMNAYEMVVEACEQLDSLVDFSIYDNNNDGVIDFVFAFYAGEGEHAGGGSDTVWPHAWSVSSAAYNTYMYDGVKLDSYACSCESLYGQYDGVGTFCHEFTHVLGLPDIYDVNYSSTTFTPGSFDILDQGSYNGATSGSCPAGVNTYERYELGWLQPEALTPGTIETLTYLGESNRAFILPVKSPTADPRDGEYYLFENRQKTGWDSYIPGHGMLVWHIDYQESKWWSNNVNTTANHQGVDIVEADNKRNSYSQDSDPFPGTKNVRSLTANTTPALLGWDSHSSSKMSKPIGGAALEDIKEVTDNELSEWKVITFSYNDDTTAGGGEPIEGATTVLLEDFASVQEGGDKMITDSTTPFEGNESFPEVVNAYKAGKAVRIGKLRENGSLTSRELGNPENATLSVDVWVKGWSNVEGDLIVSVAGQEEIAQTLQYSATIFDEYESLSCQLTNCPANVRVMLSTSEKRCFISSVRIISTPNTSGIDHVIMDQAPAQQAPTKLWINGQMMISTGNGLYNMQGVRQ